MVQYVPVQTDQDLLGILDLQRRNLAIHLTTEEILSQGYVTISHSPHQLSKLHAIEPSIIAKDGDRVIGYALVMTAESKNDIPIIRPMFDMFDRISYRGKPVSDYHYLVVGQICIDKDYRGKGVFEKLYEAYHDRYKEKYDFAITEIAADNLRSLRAHERIGFSLIHQYNVPNSVQWNIVIWDWNPQ